MKANKIILTIALLSSCAMYAAEQNAAADNVSQGSNAAAQLNAYWGMNGVAGRLRPDVTQWHVALPAMAAWYLLQTQSQKVASLQGVNQVLTFVSERTQTTPSELLGTVQTHAGLLAADSLWNITDDGMKGATAGTAFIWAGRNLGRVSKEVTLSNGAVGGYLFTAGYEQLPEEMRAGVQAATGTN
ncbi:hypothetical protein K9K77_00255 [Candidatus Babeliales bacterium]|nr:hypothetical protein [Candidatus Babeliales bacterium]